ncbi:hypothetical protein GCM10027289_16150 [Tsukamurella serpentis]
MGALVAKTTDSRIRDILNAKLGHFAILRADGKPGGTILAGTTVAELKVEGLDEDTFRSVYGIEREVTTIIISLPALIIPFMVFDKLSSKALLFWYTAILAVAVGLVTLILCISPSVYRGWYKLKLSPAGMILVVANVTLGFLAFFGVLS